MLSGYITSPQKVSGFEFQVSSLPGYRTRNPKLETRIWWLWVDSNHQPRAYETLALFRLSYTAEIQVSGFGLFV